MAMRSQYQLASMYGQRNNGVHRMISRSSVYRKAPNRAWLRRIQPRRDVCARRMESPRKAQAVACFSQAADQWLARAQNRPQVRLRQRKVFGTNAQAAACYRQERRIMGLAGCAIQTSA